MLAKLSSKGREEERSYFVLVPPTVELVAGLVVSGHIEIVAELIRWVGRSDNESTRNAIQTESCSRSRV